MKLVTFTHRDSTRVGVVKDDSIADICTTDPSIPRDMINFLSGGNLMLAMARRAAASASTVPLASVKLEAPVRRPLSFLPSD